MAERAVPFLDLRRLHESIDAELHAAFDDILGSGAFVGRSACEGFEKAFAAAHGRVAAAGCGSGTDALALALRAAGIRERDEVIVPSMTFVATAEAVVHCGATPVLADVDDETLLLTQAAVERVRSDRTAGVLPVHLYGHVVPFDDLRAWRSDGLAVVEDAAQAHLATWHGETVGTVGQAACFSFYPGKNLGALGDAGAVVSDDEDLIERVKRSRDHGRASKYLHDEVGWCSRMDGLQAAFLAAKLPHLPGWTESRRARAEQYRANLGDDAIPGVRLVPWEDGAVHHLLCVRVPAEHRDELSAALGRQGIGTGIHYPVALSEQPALRDHATPCPVAERASRELLSLPMDPLMSGDEVDLVCEVLASLAKELDLGDGAP